MPIPDELPCLNNTCQERELLRQLFESVQALENNLTPANDENSYPTSVTFATDGSDGQYTVNFNDLPSFNLRVLAQPPATGTYVWGAVDGVQQWLETEACP